MICNGEKACSGNAVHTMNSGAGKPVAVVCCGEGACEGNYQLDVNVATSVYGHCKGKDACKGNVDWTVASGGSLHVSCTNSGSACDDADFEVLGGGVATCSGNCNKVDTNRRRLGDAAAPAGDWCAARCPACAVVDGGNGFDFGDAPSCVCFDGAVPDGTEVTLTPYDDCARVSGNELYVYADDGDDIVEAVGDYIYLDGGWGDDTLAASGGYNYVVGQGGVDTCFNGGEGGCTCEIKDCGDEDEPSAAAAP